MSGAGTWRVFKDITLPLIRPAVFSSAGLVFMITAPLLEFAVDVSPPKMNADSPKDEKNLVLSISPEGQFFYGADRVSLSELQARLRALARTAPETDVLIRADASRPYGEVMAVMRCVRNAGIAGVSLLTEPEDER
jgi:biopolymer transport protein TolR